MKSWRKEAVGIEIFSGGARFVKLGFHQDKIELEGFGQKGSKNSFLDLDGLAGELSSVFSGKRVQISFPGQSSQTYRLKFPAEILSGGEEQLKWELGQKVSSSRQAYDFFVHSTGKECFLGTAVRKAACERVADSFAQKGAADLSFTGAGFALVSLFQASELPPEGSVALVNLAEDFTTLVVLDKGELTYVSEIATPPGLSEETEGELASAHTLLRESLLERFGVELSTLVHLLGFRATVSGRIGTVYLSGPLAAGDLAATVGQMGGVRVGHFTCPALAFPVGEMPERWAIAAGLALSSSNENPSYLSPSEGGR